MGDEEFPDAGSAKTSHLVDPSIPAVEVADNRNRLGVWCPYPKNGTTDIVYIVAMCT